MKQRSVFVGLKSTSVSTEKMQTRQKRERNQKMAEGTGSDVPDPQEGTLNGEPLTKEDAEQTHEEPDTNQREGE
jgi:hypothetical protein